MSRVGRPRLSSEEIKKYRVTVSLNAKEYQLLNKISGKNYMSLSAMIRALINKVGDAN
jgi:hypothetical protein